MQAGAWMLATAAAVTLSWFGVHTVLARTAYDAPRALPVQEDAADRGGAPRASSTHRPKPAPSHSPSPSASRSPGHGGSHSPDDGARHGGSAGPDGGAGSGGAAGQAGGGSGSGSASGGGDVRGATVRGGRAVFDMGDDSASLVSATPDGGWSMQVWKSPGWIRVTFSRSDSSSTVFCRWDDGPPRIEKFDG